MVAMTVASVLLLAILTGAVKDAPDNGPAVGTFKLAPALSVYGAYHNKSMNTWGGALVHVPEDKATPYHMYVNQPTNSLFLDNFNSVSSKLVPQNLSSTIIRQACYQYCACSHI